MGFLDSNKPAFTYVFHSRFLVLPAGHLESDGSHPTHTIRAAGATEALCSTLLILDPLQMKDRGSPCPHSPCHPQPFNISVPETEESGCWLNSAALLLLHFPQYQL